MLEYKNSKILIDCGMLQGTEDAFEFNSRAFPYDVKSLDALIVTHAHIDHIGLIPKLVKDGFTGKIISTHLTRELVPYMLEDAARLSQRDAQMHQHDPLYTIDDVHKALTLWTSVDYHEQKEVTPDITFLYKDAGHILGSGMALITCGDKKIAFTGDLGNTPSPLMNNTEYLPEADYMVMESVYGDRNHPDTSQRQARLVDEIKASLALKGTILIPIFSLEKTQVLLHELNHLFESGALPKVPVYMDSPLASKVTSVYARAKKAFNKEAQKEIDGGDDIFDFPGLIHVEDGHASAEILHTPNPKIIVAGSGMSTGGRIVAHEKLLLGNPQNSIIFIGYQSVGTLGRRLVDRTPTVTIGGDKIKVKARVSEVQGYSSHKDSEHLLEFVSQAKNCKKIFVAMGESKSALFLAQRIHDYLGINAVHPEEGESVILE
jgi:metallo-beta-lactamase family protein